MSISEFDALLASCSHPAGPVVIEAPDLSADEATRLARALEGRGIVTHVIDGSRLTSKADILHEVAAAFGFPDYFGNNWDALVDCWSDMSWKPAKGYVTILLHADAFHTVDRAAYDTFVSVCEDVAERWREYDPALAFKLVRGGGTHLTKKPAK